MINVSLKVRKAFGFKLISLIWFRPTTQDKFQAKISSYAEAGTVSLLDANVLPYFPDNRIFFCSGLWPKKKKKKREKLFMDVSSFCVLAAFLSRWQVCRLLKHTGAETADSVSPAPLKSKRWQKAVRKLIRSGKCSTQFSEISLWMVLKGQSALECVYIKLKRVCWLHN